MRLAKSILRLWWRIKLGLKQVLRIIENVIKRLENGKPEFTEISFFKIKKFNGKSI